jgi:flagellar FliL protein
VLDEHDHSIADAAHAKEAVTPPEGFGPLPQEAVIRDIVTDTLTDRDAGELVRRHGRERLKKRIMSEVDKHTDVHLEDVLFTDVAVQ